MRPDFLRGPRGKAKPLNRSFRCPHRFAPKILPRPASFAYCRGSAGKIPHTGGPAIDRFLILFALMVSALILADLTLHDGTVLLFLSRELLDLVDYLVVWR